MSAAPIENEIQYRAARTRIAALESYLAAIVDLQCRAAGDRTQLRIEDEDLRDLAPLEDAVADITYTRERLLDAAAEWENLVEFGHRRDRLAPRRVSIHR